MGIWMFSNPIYADPGSQTGFGGEGNYVGVEVCSTDSLLVEGDYYYSNTYAPMTWYEAEFGYPYNWTTQLGNFEWIDNGIINVSKQNGVYTFTFVMVSESGSVVERYYTGGVTYNYVVKK